MATFIYAGDAGAFKTCSKCGELKSLTDFNLSSKERLGVRNRCRDCQTADGAAFYAANAERERARGKVYRANNPEISRARVKRWRDANRDRFRAWNNDYNARNPDRNRKSAANYYVKRKDDPKYKISSAMKANVHRALTKGTKQGVSTFLLLGYTCEELICHLEGNFLPGMTWDNYGIGGWEVDHIIPLSAFNYSSPDHYDFKLAWALSNLRPMWASDNRSKGAKLSAGFQPSLAF